MTNFKNNASTDNQIHITVYDSERVKIIKDFKKIVMNSGLFRDYTEGYITAIKNFNEANKQYLDTTKKSK